MATQDCIALVVEHKIACGWCGMTSEFQINEHTTTALIDILAIHLYGIKLRFKWGSSSRNHVPLVCLSFPLLVPHIATLQQHIEMLMCM